MSRQDLEASLRAGSSQIELFDGSFSMYQVETAGTVVLMVQAHVHGVVHSCPQSTRLYEDHESIGRSRVDVSLFLTAAVHEAFLVPPEEFRVCLHKY